MDTGKFFKELAKLLVIIVIMGAVGTGVMLGGDGIPVTGIPKTDEISSVTAVYKHMDEEVVTEVTDEEHIRLCVDMTSLLKYLPLAKVNADAAGDGPLVTLCFHLKSGKDVEVAANKAAVFTNGKKHMLKDHELFINIAEEFFFPDGAAG